MVDGGSWLRRTRMESSTSCGLGIHISSSPPTLSNPTGQAIGSIRVRLFIDTVVEVVSTRLYFIACRNCVIALVKLACID